MLKNFITRKVIISSIVFVVLTGSIGIVGAYNMSKSEKRTEYETLKNDFDNKINALNDNSKDAKEKTKLAKEAKEEAVKISALEDEVKTKEEFAEELKVALSSAKMGLEDTKLSDDAKINADTKRFIQKMEKKIARIEKDFEEGNKAPGQLLKELRDRSDVDN
ncbi:MAG: hypothetical protein GX270_02580 [Clostridiaceae bacterium]|jgi:tRNA U34 5-carboxymethylaminomethyl modifying enzyme MnmG/GidA|nr:hypothetical protein [Clostridiaceae bacterium]